MDEVDFVWNKKSRRESSKFNAMDSGFRRNDELIRVSLVIEQHSGTCMRCT
jgi:hypothetical protein